MNVKLYNAALTQLRGKAMESLALIEMYLNNPTLVPDHSSVVEEVMKHAKLMSEYESAFASLQQYFQPRHPSAAPGPSKVPQPPVQPPITEEELYERSQDFRKSPAGKAMSKRKKEPKTNSEGNL